LEPRAKKQKRDDKLNAHVTAWALLIRFRAHRGPQGSKVGLPRLYSFVVNERCGLSAQRLEAVKPGIWKFITTTGNFILSIHIGARNL